VAGGAKRRPPAPPAGHEAPGHEAPRARGPSGTRLPKGPREREEEEEEEKEAQRHSQMRRPRVVIPSGRKGRRRDIIASARIMLQKSSAQHDHSGPPTDLKEAADLSYITLKWHMTKTLKYLHEKQVGENIDVMTGSW